MEPAEDLMQLNLWLYAGIEDKNDNTQPTAITKRPQRMCYLPI